MPSKGFTIIEILLAMFLLATGVVAIAGASVLATRTTLQVEKKVAAQAIANDAIEEIQAMLYSSVGILLPDGATVVEEETEYSIRYTEQVIQNEQNYTVTTDVVGVDDEINGTLSGALTLASADYKQVRIEVTPEQGDLLGSVVSAAATVSNWPPQSCKAGEPNACPAPSVPTRSATYTFTDYYQIRDFINSMGLYTTIPSSYGYNSGVENTIETAQKVCELKGYTTVVSRTNGNFGSCSDNGVAQWDSDENDFVVTSSCPSGNHLRQLTCGSPKIIPVCTSSLPCPLSGQCTDAYRARGYTPAGTQYPSFCKSNLDCNTGYVCNAGSGQCTLGDIESYEYVTTGDPKASGETADCTTKQPHASYGTGWTLHERHVFSEHRDMCVWKRPSETSYEYKLVPKNSGYCNLVYDSSFSRKSSGCVSKADCPDESSGSSNKADYCLYEKEGGGPYPDITFSLDATSTAPEANCANAPPSEAHMLSGSSCLLKSGSQCTSSLCLWQNASVCPM